MDFLTKFRRQVRWYLFGVVLLENAALLAAWWGVENYQSQLPDLLVLIGLSLLALCGSLLLSDSAGQHVTGPVVALWKAIQHVAPHGAQEAAPDLKQYRLGQEMIATLASHVYQLASIVQTVERTNTKAKQDLHTNFVASNLPLPLLVLDKAETIVYANETAAQYLAKPTSELVGQNLYTTLDMSFRSNDTLANWLKDVQGKAATSSHKWERVRIGLPGQGDSKQFDLAGYYNQANPLGYETLLVLFDHTEEYSQDDQAMSFVALSVHELRTPLTLLRGYIEVFDEELGPTLDPELKAFMKKMNASAQQLAAFVDNILNVAKIEDNQLVLQLHEENWQSVVENVVRDLSLRSGVRGITIKTDIAKALPSVGVDRYSIYEVLANLLDNAIKYSNGTNEIYVTALVNKDGLVETSVKDFGLGIDSSILPHIFDKFYRNHRNRAQIGGTGLGLYLSKAIVDAHGGQIWVNSKVSEGSTFTFTLLPFSQLTEADKAGSKPNVTRNAHGWIKNHSLYRD
ncbi:MAG TPA: ATP-binding protein [Candidatus Saccharimonadales bacterium]|nr:ATP-binding protein [Candidatus Saccharimonadales bacterium]